LQAEPCRPQLQLLFGGFPAALSQPVVGGQFVKARRQRALALFFAAHRRLCGDDRRGMEQQGIAPALCHKIFSFFSTKNAPARAILVLRRCNIRRGCSVL
jgi:hypothetical protein